VLQKCDNVFTYLYLRIYRNEGKMSMDESDFSKFGQNIRDTVSDAVNSAMESMDFSGLSEKVSATADHIVEETVNAFGGTYSRNGNKRNVTFGTRARENAVYPEKTDEEKLALRFVPKVPGKVSGTLMCTFGGIGTAGFGIPAFILLALGLAGHPIVLSLGVIGFLPFAIASGALLKSGCDRLGRISRFERYKRCIGTKALCAVRSLSGAVGLPEKKVRREIESMIAKGYFLQGHMDDEKSCLILDDETYQLYLQSKEQVENARRQGRGTANASTQEASSSAASSKNSKDVQRALEVGMEYIRQIRQINDELPQPVITEKLSHLEEVIGLIYLRVEKTPEKLSSLKHFTDYYLPTTMRLVTAYRDLDHVDTENARQSKEQIERTLDTINDAFDKLLDSLYEEDRMNIQADIAVLKTLLAQEGLVDDGLHAQ
jgi:5-bromo-4-chloroindolyl phosphate hydrolysis protein